MYLTLSITQELRINVTIRQKRKLRCKAMVCSVRARIKVFRFKQVLIITNQARQ